MTPTTVSSVDSTGEAPTPEHGSDRQGYVAAKVPDTWEIIHRADD